MLVNPTYGGGGNSADYVRDGAVAIMESVAASNPSDCTLQLEDTLTIDEGLTMEICGVVNSAPSGYQDILNVDYHWHLSSQVDSSVPASSDFGFVCWISGHGSNELFVYPDNMSFGDRHTFTFVTDMESVKLYIDGEQAGTIADSFGTATAYKYNVYGKGNANIDWDCARFYSKTLTAAEVAANYAVDVAKYGA